MLVISVWLRNRTRTFDAWTNCWSKGLLKKLEDPGRGTGSVGSRFKVMLPLEYDSGKLALENANVV